jgi:hypothetical protein
MAKQVPSLLVIQAARGVKYAKKLWLHRVKKVSREKCEK